MCHIFTVSLTSAFIILFIFTEKGVPELKLTSMKNNQVTAKEVRTLF